MMINGLLVVREDDNSYKLVDAEGRVPGYVVRHVRADGTKQFRGCGGVSYDTMSQAVGTFMGVKWLKLRAV